MSVNMAASLKKQLAKDPSLISSTNDRGWTLLHHEALAGSAPTVMALLEARADPTSQTNDGKTPLQLAQSLGWDNVVALLTSISQAPM
jgi:ankyrin repeat protein